MKVPQPIETPPPTPEQLLLLLESGFARQRSARASKPRNRARFLAVGIAVILVGAGLALLIAEHLLSDLLRGGGMAPPAAEMQKAR